MGFKQAFADRVFGQEMPDAVASYEAMARGFTRHHIVNGHMPPEDVRMAWSSLREMRRAIGPSWEMDRGRTPMDKPTMRPK